MSGTDWLVISIKTPCKNGKEDKFLTDLKHDKNCSFAVHNMGTKYSKQTKVLAD